MLETVLLRVWWVLFDEYIKKSAETNETDGQDVSKGTDNINMSKNTQNSQNKVNEILQSIRKGSATKQLLVGAASGWVTGFLTIKIGKTAAFAVGSGIILYKVAHHQGIKIDTKPLRDQAEKITKSTPALKNTPAYLEEMKKFTGSQTPFTAGFVGGFLLGIAM